MGPRLTTPSDTPELLRLAAMMYSSMGLDANRSDWREQATKLLAYRLGGDDLVVSLSTTPIGPAGSPHAAALRSSNAFPGR